jgi:Cu/Ag efflux pump CusA
MSIVVLGGLVTATFTTLFLLPALYLRLAPPRRHEPAQGQPVAG